MDAITVAAGDRPDSAAADSNPRPVLEVECLVKRYGKAVAVDGATFQVFEGEIFGLLGPNGAGKTTTISTIATLLRPGSGGVRIGGHDTVAGAHDARRLIGLVPQEISLYHALSARENLEYFGGLYGLRGRALRDRIAELLDVTGLTPYARKPAVAKFSGGMRRRLNLAAGLLHRPRLLLLDEPTVGVDPQSRNHIFENIRRLNREDGVSVLYTTHYMEEAQALCDRVAIMDHGRIIACDSVASLLSSMSGTVLRVSLVDGEPAFQHHVAAQSGIVEVNRIGELEYQVLAEDQQRGLEALLAAASARGVRFRELDVSPPNLEQVFLKLTGKDLRDA